MIEISPDENKLKEIKIINQYGVERIVVSIVINIIFGISIFVGLKSLQLSIIISIILSLLITISGFLFLTKKLPGELIGFRKQKPIYSILWLLLSLVCIVQTVRLSAFMIDPAQSQHSLFPGDKWLVEHCCLTAYSESARFTSEGEINIYNPEIYFGPEFAYNKEHRRKLGSFQIDLYHYPPPFLLLPIITKSIVGDNFLNIRMFWFAISVISLITAIGLIILLSRSNR